MTNKKTNKSDLDSLITPEIKNDEFYNLIQEIAATSNIKSILEIGSSSGGGSTEAFVKGIQNNPHKPTLYCMEVSQVRFAQLQQTYSYADFVKCYNLSSIAVESFPTKEEVIEFYNTSRTGLNNYPLEEVLRWLDQDIAYVVSSGASENGIKRIKEENSIDYFDVVLIDGSEFTGESELAEVYGARILLLDDINTFKNYRSYHKLLKDSNYRLIQHNFSLRNGYAIFQRQEFVFNEEQTEQLLVQRLVRQGMTVFDVGANIGNYSILFSNLVGSEGKVYSFEPTSTIFSKLEERIKSEKNKNIFSFQNAVFSENKLIEFNEFPDDFSVWNSIGVPRMENPSNPQEYVPIVKTETVSAITLDSFCQEHHIEKIDYLKIDVEGAESDVITGALNLLARKNIKFIQFEISQKMLEGMNRTAQETFDLLIANGYECHSIQKTGAIGQSVINSNSFYENYIAFPLLPIHFFTIVLNGEPFIRYHIDVFKELSFKWHWHIVEGVADLKHDTAWSTRQGGHIAGNIHHNGRSNDGTTEYIDELARLYPENITIYRKPEGEFWDGKREMVQAPLANITEECLLWQVDVDELWTVEQIWLSRQLFIESPEKTAAYYWCWYFVGEKLVISTRNCYAQNPKQEWLRTWRFKPGYTWAAHEPPILVEHLADDNIRDVAKINPLLHEETEKYNLVFQHYSYVLPEQLKFKETYYGYKSAESQWLKLQEAKTLPLFLSEYLSWVTDGTRVDSTESLEIVPIAQKDSQTDIWKFLSSLELNEKSLYAKPKSKKDFRPIIAIDGVFFQLYKTGIARVWTSLLEEWAANGFAQNIVVFDREGSAPKIAGIWYRTVDRYDYAKTDADRQMLQKVCDEEGVQLFISTYYTTSMNTPSVFMAYDMIPEVFRQNLEKPMWREKHIAIQHASSYITISENTAQDLVKYFPAISPNLIQIAHCGIKDIFSPASLEEIRSFKTKYGIAKSYFLLVGVVTGYKNLELFLEAFALLPTKQSFEIVITGAGTSLENKLRSYTSGSVVHMLQLSNEDLRIAYTGAIALVYPSKYEGFGLPVLEALACGCPVITCPNSSIPEVAGEAAIYVQDDDVNGLANALCDVQKPQVRQVLIKTGLEQSKKFSWTKMAEKVSSALLNATLLDLNLRDINLIIFPDWAADEESLGLELAEVVKAIATHPKSSQITLLINTNNIDQDEANLLLSSVAMHLLMEEELEIPEYVEISLVGHLEEIQGQTLLPRLQGRILLENEDKKATFIEKIPAISILEL
ncbi:FkbM family methyltransferase [Dolichospermum sp. ST_con]|nr:FkbM family methyltransferase [Dolichospermum sp. ST_con]